MNQEKKSWLDRNEYPFKSHYWEVNNQQLHYVDEGSGDTLLFVHGTPSWSFDFRHIIKALRDDYRCIAVDHIGFGLSSKPYEYDYTTQNHSKTLEKFVLEKNLRNLTLVVHDFGGPIGLNIATKFPERIDRIIAINSWLWSSEGDPAYQKMRSILKSPLLPFLYRTLNFSAQYLLPRSFGKTKPTPHIRKHYTRVFENRKQREGTLAFARSLLNDQGWFESIWNKRISIVNKPMLLIWGMKDPFITSAYLEKFESGFPMASSRRLNHAGHFPQEESPREVIQFIREFLRDALTSHPEDNVHLDSLYTGLRDD